MLNVVIVHENVDFCANLLNYLCAKNAEIRVIAFVNSLEKMYNFANYNCDIILLSLKFLLNGNLDPYAQTFIKKNRSSIIILSDVPVIKGKYSRFNYANENNSDMILDKILKIAPQKSTNKVLQNRIIQELQYLGYNTNHLGTNYLCEMIYIIYNTNFYDSLEKHVYPFLCQRHSKSINTIKCNIINATNLMLCNCPADKLSNYLGRKCDSKLGPKTIMYAVVNKLPK